MKAYKLTNTKFQTRNNTQWGENITHTATGSGTELCSDGFIHFYMNPLVAAFVYPLHINWTNPILWECEASGETIHEALKSGCKTLTTIRQVEMVKPTATQLIAFGILCTKKVCHNEAWNLWADRWLSGEDRSKEAARIAADAVKYIAHAAYDAAYYAATYAYVDAVDVAGVAGGDKIDFEALCVKAMKY